MLEKRQKTGPKLKLDLGAWGLGSKASSPKAAEQVSFCVWGSELRAIQGKTGRFLRDGH